MDNSVRVVPRGLRALLWIARIPSAILVAFVALFAIAYAINPQGEGPPELPDFALFPIGVCAGLALGWRWPLLGGIVTTACMTVFLVVIRQDLLTAPVFALFLLPALLYIIYGLASRKCAGGS